MILCLLFYVYISITFAVSSSLTSDDSKCKQINPCTCKFENGHVVDLSLFKYDNSSLASDGDLKFYFHPCYDVPLGNDSSGNSCGKSSVCLYNETSKNHTTLGTADEATFVSTSINDPLYLHYKHADTSTIIWLRCSLDVSSNLVAHIESNKSYTLTLSSREVCPLFVPTGSNTSIWIPAAKLLETTSTTTTTTTIQPPTSTPIPVHLHSGLSTGSLLVILFITFSSIYFFGGVLALKLLRGAEGKEMIPNYDFWADVPYLCRDGILFLVSGCNPAPAYERI